MCCLGALLEKNQAIIYETSNMDEKITSDIRSSRKICSSERLSRRRSSSVSGDGGDGDGNGDGDGGGNGGEE